MDKFHDIVRLGVFHTICTLLAMGKRLEDAGLQDLCIESGMIAQSSIAGVAARTTGCATTQVPVWTIKSNKDCVQHNHFKCMVSVAGILP